MSAFTLHLHRTCVIHFFDKNNKLKYERDEYGNWFEHLREGLVEHMEYLHHYEHLEKEFQTFVEVNGNPFDDDE